MQFVAMIVIGIIAFSAITAYACCVVSGMCAEDEYAQWTDDGGDAS